MVAATRSARSIQPVQLDPPVQWYAPQSLWRAIPRAEMSQRRGVPVILRFATDTFMEDLIALLASGQADSLSAYPVQAETWRDNPAAVGWDADGRDGSAIPKLYQASHQRFYLVAGALACRIPGVPDRVVDSSQQESVFFVMRQLDANGGEYGWNTSGWTLLQDPANTLADGEQRHPLFPLSFPYDGTTRRLLTGLIPVASREAAPSLTAALIGTVSADADPRPGLFEQQVTASLAGALAWFTTHEPQGSSYTPISSLAPDVRRPTEHALAYAFMDLMTALHDNVPALYNDIIGSGISSAASKYGSAESLASLIYYAVYAESILKAIDAASTRDYLLNTMGAGGDVKSAPGLSSVWNDDHIWVALTSWVRYTDQNFGTMALQVDYAQALTTPYTPPISQYPSLPQSDPGATKLHVIRMVYERPQCDCLTISAPTRPFQLATFFDPDAPVRPIRIAMPVDTSTEGLKKYGKGFSVIISSQLKAQMDRVSSLKDMMDGNANPEGTIDLGMICSFSIPIITICALILLMIIVSLLNIIFWWLPLFKICLPLPKSSSGG